MDRLLYISAIGAAQIERAQSVHANNLANVSTTGFQADLAQARAEQVNGDGLPVRVYGMSEGVGIDYSRGDMIETGRNLDVAIRGDGYIAVLAPDGTEAYTRTGSLNVDSLGQLTTRSGLSVLGDGGPIAMPPFQSLTIGQDGFITVRPQGQGPETLVQVDRIKLVAPNHEDLVKGADGLLRRVDEGVELPSIDIGLVSGFLEGSNVNPVAEMTEIVALARQFEIEVRMMRMAEENDESSARLVQVG